MGNTNAPSAAFRQEPRKSRFRAASTADLKSLTHSWQNRFQGLQIESGTRNIGLLVPMTFRSS